MDNLSDVNSRQLNCVYPKCQKSTAYITLHVMMDDEVATNQHYNNF